MKMAKQRSEPIRLFYGYSRKDEKLRDELEKRLASLPSQEVIQSWYDRKISAGRKWKIEITENLKAADVILLLLSANFMTSKYCREREMKLALQRVDKARVIPIILRSVDWKTAPIKDLQVLPKNGKPITDWKEQDAAWTHVTEEISQAIRELINERLLARIKPKKFKKQALSLNDMRAGAEVLCDLVERRHNFDPEILIAVNQGGMIAAAAMNKHWRKPVGIMHTTVTENARVVKDFSLPCEIKAGRKVKLKPKKILVVDPKLKTGESAESINSILRSEYGQEIDLRYAIVLAYGGWAPARWQVTHSTPFEWPVQFKPRDLRAYVAYYTEQSPHTDQISEAVRPGWRKL